MKTIWLGLCVAVGLALAVWASIPPSPLPANAPADRFSASRALSDIKQIARKPHPVGSPEHARVRAYIVKRLTAMGLQPRVFTADSVLAGFKNFARAARTSSIIAILPGKNPKLPALALMAHYDSVPNSPGAADDTASVAAILEILRALKAGAQPERDVIAVITDGEEVGLMGAKAFFDQDPLAKHIGVVLNMEARGDSGLTAMFETGENNAGLIAAYAATAHHPSANSLSGALYARMPNGTDFTIVKQHGATGLNFAFIGEQSAYHSPLATPEHLNLASVQHMGDQTLPVARALAMADTIPQAGYNAVYSDVFGFFLIHYPPDWGWGLVALAVLLVGYGLWAGRKEASPCPLNLARGLGGALAPVILTGLILWPAGLWIGQLDYFQRLPHYAQFLLGCTALLLAAITLAVAMLRLGSGRQSLRAASAQLWRGALILGLIVSVALQAVLPQATPLALWPLLISAIAFALARGRSNLLIGGIALILTAGWVGSFGLYLFDAMGVTSPALWALPLLFVMPALAPVLGEAAEDRALMPIGLVLLAFGAASVAYARYAPPCAANPLPVSVVHVQNHDSGKAWRVSGFKRLDPWTRQALSPDGTPPVMAKIPGYTAPLWSAPAKPITVAAPKLEITRKDGRLTLAAQGRKGDYLIELYLKSSAPLGDAKVNGAKTEGKVEAGTWTRTVFYASGDRVQSWSLKAPAHARIEAIVQASQKPWPKTIKPLPPMPDNLMPFGISGYSQSVVTREVKW